MVQEVKSKHSGRTAFWVVLLLFVVWSLSAFSFYFVPQFKDVLNPPQNPEDAVVAPVGSSAASDAGLTSDLAKLSVVQRVVQQTISYSLTIADRDQATDALQKIVADHKGTIESLHTFATEQDCNFGPIAPALNFDRDFVPVMYPGECRSYNVFASFRVPSTEVQAVRSALKGITSTGSFDSESIDTQDVSSQANQLDTQLAAQRAEEKALEALLEKTTTTREVLDIRSQLTNIRLQIQYLEEAKANLSKDVNSTLISVYMTEAQNKSEQALSLVERSALLLDHLANFGVIVVLFWITGVVILPVVVIGMLIGYLIKRLTAKRNRA